VPIKPNFVITTGSGRGTRRRISVATPLPPPRTIVPPATPAPPLALADGAAEQRAERVRREVVVRDALGNVGEAIRRETHGPAESSAKPLPPPRDHVLPAALNDVLQRAPQRVEASASSKVFDALDQMLDAELAAFKALPEVDKLLRVAGFETPTDIDRLTTAVEQLPRILELIKIYLPVRFRLTTTMRRRGKASELHLCLDVLRQLFARMCVHCCVSYLLLCIESTMEFDTSGDGNVPVLVRADARGAAVRRRHIRFHRVRHRALPNHRTIKGRLQEVRDGGGCVC
jgi:hypothetical protein